MKAAMVATIWQGISFWRLERASSCAGESRVAVTAGAFSPVVKARAAGTHYSSSGEFRILIDWSRLLKDGGRPTTSSAPCSRVIPATFLSKFNCELQQLLGLVEIAAG
jgi:hypothetical protein